MGAKYIIRLDDACQTMDHAKWLRMENLLDKYAIKPMVAVIPDNKDSSFNCERVNDNTFWNRVRAWQKKGWEIAQHGYTHEYVSKNSGDFTIGNNYSEFAGLLYRVQKEKIKKGYQLLQEKGITVTLWIAPAHTFDYDTVRALREETDITTISDGIALYPYKHKGFVWIPVQVANFIKVPFGYWTICIHPNEFSDKDFNKLESAIQKFHSQIVAMQEVKVYEGFFIKIVNYIFKIIFNLLIKYKRKFHPQVKS
ncbi:DUF2334 domain-containing protein [bacterium]|nr:DUF2334 domain-containing protein [bacterium]MBU1958244.1 DUF2334 domain-containing protein [bacterium]